MSSWLSLLTLSALSWTVSSLIEWPDPADLPSPSSSAHKPQNWKEKNLGQWCRNFTLQLHRQCPEGSFAHEFNCCGESGAECCWGLQGWLIVILSSAIFVLSSTFLFYILLRFKLICVEENLSRSPSYSLSK